MPAGEKELCGLDCALLLLLLCLLMQNRVGGVWGAVAGSCLLQRGTRSGNVGRRRLCLGVGRVL
jgi:hypothetical protein